MKQNSILFWKPGSRVTSGELLKVFSTKVYLYLLYYIMALRCYLLHLIKQNCLLQSFPNTLQVKLQILLQFNDIGISLPDFFFRTNLKLDNIMATLTLVKKVMTNLVRQKCLVLIVFQRWFWQTVSLDFFLSGFFFPETDDSQDSAGREGFHALFLSVTSKRSQTFRYFFATLHVRWLPCALNRNACNFQNSNQWNLPPYWVTTWLIDEVMSISISLLDDLILCFWYNSFTWEIRAFQLACTDYSNFNSVTGMLLRPNNSFLPRVIIMLCVSPVIHVMKS